MSVQDTIINFILKKGLVGDGEIADFEAEVTLQEGVILKIKAKSIVINVVTLQSKEKEVV